MERNKLLHLWKILIFSPLLIYLGDRSLIAFDEGFYALQAKWILNTNNWIAPMWWGQISFDRTIGVQFLIALSQKLFNKTDFSIFIPSLMAASLMLIFTYYLHKELLGERNAIASPLILSTTFLWINYAHMATQDIIFASIVTGGLLSSIKASHTKRNIFLFFSGFWIGLGAMFKTYLVAIPFLAILPFLYISGILFRRSFWIGTLVGFFPFIFWSYKILITYGISTYRGLFDKLILLSKNNNFTNPFYYYLWNLPINILPWSLFSVIGFFNQFKEKDNTKRFFLFIYPLIIIFLLSLFSTKTPYYPLQILSIVSINSFSGINYFLKNNFLYKKIINKILFFLMPIIIFSLFLIINLYYSNLFTSYYQKIYINLGLLGFVFSWILLNFTNLYKQKLILILLGPYFLISFLVQSGTLNDRSMELRVAMEDLVKNESLSKTKVEVVKSELGGEEKNSKIIKIALQLPKVGQGITNIEDLEKNHYAWTNQSRSALEKKVDYEIISDSKIFNPWKLVLKK